MEEYRKYEPIFGSWKLERLIGRGSFGKVFEISREEFGTSYRAALKIISVPQDDDDVKSRMAAGTDMETISEYYEGILKEIVSENEIMSKLKGNSNIVSYEDHQIIPHGDGVGYDVLIRMELLTPLLDRMIDRSLAEKEVVKLGIDICKALELCHRKNIIHRDIKPQNIFISENGDYKLGDFGIARTMEKTTGGMSRKGTYKYMAPEVFRGEDYDSTVDIYSLGIVLYTLMNGNRGPFLPPPPAKVTHIDEEEARMRRFKGEELPAPRDTGTMLAYIIKKACAADPAARYKTAEQMRRDLESYLANYHTQETVMDTAAGAGFDQRRSSDQTPPKQTPPNQKPPKQPPKKNDDATVILKKKSNSWIAWVAAAVVIAAVGIAAVTGVFSKKEEVDLSWMMEEPYFIGDNGSGKLLSGTAVDEDKKELVLAGISDEKEKVALDRFLSGVEYTCADDGTLSNGDITTIYAEYDSAAAKDAKVELIGTYSDVTVSGLTEEEEEVQPVVKNGFTIGETYTVIAKEGVAVRSTPERLDKRANQVMYDALSDEYKAQADGKSGDHAALKQGAKVQCLDMDGDWMRITDGWVCVYYDGEELIK